MPYNANFYVNGIVSNFRSAHQVVINLLCLQQQINIGYNGNTDYNFLLIECYRLQKF